MRVLIYCILLLSSSVLATEYQIVNVDNPKLANINVFDTQLYLIGDWHRVYTIEAKLQLFDQIIQNNSKVNCLYLETNAKNTDRIRNYTVEEVLDYKNKEFKPISYIAFFGEISVWAQKNNLKIIANDMQLPDGFTEIERGRLSYDGYGSRSSYLARYKSYLRNQYFVKNIKRHQKTTCDSSIFLVGAAHITESGVIDYFNNEYEPITAPLARHGVNYQSILVSPYMDLKTTTEGISEDATKPGKSYIQHDLSGVDTFIFHY